MTSSSANALSCRRLPTRWTALCTSACACTSTTVTSQQPRQPVASSSRSSSGMEAVLRALSPLSGPSHYGAGWTTPTHRHQHQCYQGVQDQQPQLVLAPLQQQLQVAAAAQQQQVSLQFSLWMSTSCPRNRQHSSSSSRSQSTGSQASSSGLKSSWTRRCIQMTRNPSHGTSCSTGKFGSYTPHVNLGLGPVSTWLDPSMQCPSVVLTCACIRTSSPLVKHAGSVLAPDDINSVWGVCCPTETNS